MNLSNTNYAQNWTTHLCFNKYSLQPEEKDGHPVYKQLPSDNNTDIHYIYYIPEHGWVLTKSLSDYNVAIVTGSAS